MNSKYICPTCHEKAGVNIVYGMPSIEMAEQAERGEIALGGCVLDANEPERHCNACGAEWRIKRRLSKYHAAMLEDEASGSQRAF